MKLFRRRSIAVATLLGGPISGGLMLYHNFKELDRPDFARNILLCSIGVTGILLTLLLELPKSTVDKIPHYMSHLVVMGIVDLIYYVVLKRQVNAHFVSGGAKAPLWLAVRNTAIGFVVVTAIAFTMTMSKKTIDGERFTYGPVGHEIYHDKGIMTQELNEVGRALQDFGYFATTQKQAIQITTDDNSFVLRIYVDHDWWDDPDVTESLKELKTMMATYKISRPVRIQMITDTYAGTKEKEI